MTATPTAPPDASLIDPGLIDPGPIDPGPIDPGLIDWIAIDWGTTNLRAWAMSASGRPLAHARSDSGMASLAGPADFEPALLALIGPWGAHPVTAIACGMVGARQGWIEAPYARTPCPPLSPALVPAPALTPGLRLHIIPGVAQDSPADVMRGEETQIAGHLRLTPGFEGILCLPGTHTKWVRLSAGHISAFQTVMTGEIFATLATRTVLRHAIAPEGWDDAAFDTALEEGITRPERLTARLFSLRAEALLHGQGGDAARARLSGLLIGAELAATRAWWLGQEIVLIGAGRLAALYRRALAAQGVPATLTDADAVTLAGLTAARDGARDAARHSARSQA